MSNENKKPIEFPKSMSGCVSATFKGGQAEIPDDFPVTYCRPSRRGVKNKHVTRPRKAGRLITWEVAEALAPDVNLSYDEQEAKSTIRFVRNLSPEDEVKEAIAKLKFENKKLKVEVEE